MIERKVIQDNFLEFSVTRFIRKTLGDVPIKEISVEKNPVGERITIHTSTPGLVIGREGSNIKKLTETLRKEFKFENPQIKIGEVKEMFLSADIVAKRIANDLSTFGSQKFKLTAFRTLFNVMNSGAMGVEIKISGKVPSSRSKTWRFFKGYLKKTGYVSDFLVDHAVESVTLKSGVVGIQVSIMLPNTPLPDKIDLLEDVIPKDVVEKIESETSEEEPKELKETKESNNVEETKDSGDKEVSKQSDKSESKKDEVSKE